MARMIGIGRGGPWDRVAARGGGDERCHGGPISYGGVGMAWPRAVPKKMRIFRNESEAIEKDAIYLGIRPCCAFVCRPRGGDRAPPHWPRPAAPTLCALR
eukprot:3484383-Prymnesium_polylepis.1